MQHFDLCVIGSGSGNSLIDERFSDLRVALVDKGVFGGSTPTLASTLNKMFARTPDMAAAGRDAARVGVQIREARADWPAIRDRIFGRIGPIREAGEDWREQNEHVTLFREEAHFVGPKTLDVGAEQITADTFVLAAGSRPRLPDVPGFEDFATRIHTSDSVMRMQHLPKSMIIIGGGFVAAEFAHIFSALGVAVTVINRSDVLLRQQDREIAEAFTAELGERVTLRLNQFLDGFERGSHDRIAVLTTDEHGIEYAYEAETVLVAIGRIPNGDTLNLDATGVEVDEKGFVVVDEFQRTSADGIWALGDVCSPWQLKHVANHEMRVVQHNLLHPDDLVAADHRFVPNAVFSHPQVAAVGLTEEKAREQGVAYVVGRYQFADVAYGWALEDAPGHICKVLIDPETKLLLGAHLVGPDASMLIQPLIQAMSLGTDAVAMARDQYWIHPALTEVVENALLQALEDTTAQDELEVGTDAHPSP